MTQDSSITRTPHKPPPGGAFFYVSQAGFLHLDGPDRVAFLQRQTTNDVNRLTPESILTTVLVSPLARILDVLTLFNDGDGTSILTLPGYANKTASFLKSRIFFMDKVSLQDLTDQYVQIELDGEGCQEVLIRLNLPYKAQRGAIQKAELSGIQVWVASYPGLAGTAYRIIAGSDARPLLTDTLLQAGAEHLSSSDYHIFRVEAGLPGAGSELIEAYTPLEIGLDQAVAQNKGCYTGQEIIARQITYDKITQRLVGLRLQQPAEAGERIWAEGKPSGEITSAALSPHFGPIALAVVRRPYFDPGSLVAIGNADSTRTASVCALPFQ